MSLADLAEGKPERHPSKTERHPSVCHTCQVLDELPPEDAAVLITWLESTKRYTTIAQEIANDPDTPNLSTDTLRRHAAGFRDTCRERGGQRTAARA